MLKTTRNEVRQAVLSPQKGHSEHRMNNFTLLGAVISAFSGQIYTLKVKACPHTPLLGKYFPHICYHLLKIIKIWTGLTSPISQERDKVRDNHLRLVYAWSSADLQLAS